MEKRLEKWIDDMENIPDESNYQSQLILKGKTTISDMDEKII